MEAEHSEDPTGAEAASEAAAPAETETETEAAVRIEAARQTGAAGLTLAGLGLRELPPALAGLKKLEALSVRGNRLTVLPPWIADLSALTVLDLADNQLVELPGVLGTMPRLAELDLSGNRHLILPPPEVVAQGAGAVLGFLRGLDGGEPWARPAAPAPGPAIEGPAGPDAEDDSRGPRTPAGAWRIGAVAVAVALVGTAAALIGAGDAGGKESPNAAKNGPLTTSTADLQPLGATASGPDVMDTTSPSISDTVSSTGVPTTTSAPTQPSTSLQGHPTTTRLSSPPPTAPPAPQYPVAPPNQDLALGRPVTATSSKQQYVPGNIVDGDVASYWESTNGPSVFPQTVTIDLGTVTTVGRLQFALPQVADWNQRTQTITVLGAGADGNFTTVVGSRGYAFDARTGDATGVSFSPVHIRYIQLVFTANSGWPAAQLSELGVFS